MKKYTCADYRQEMVLAALRRQLAQPGLSQAEQHRLKKEIRQLELEMGMD